MQKTIKNNCKAPRGKIAYIMSRFPHLPEVFILREMDALMAMGWQIEIYPLIRQKQSVVHKEAGPWIERARWLPFVSPAVIKANIRTLGRTPGRYLSTWTRALWENRINLRALIKTMVLLPKSFYAAGLMKDRGIGHIHAHFATHPAMSAWVIHRMTGIPYSITVHAHDIFAHKAMLGTKIKDAAFIAAISDFNRNYLSEKLGSRIRHKMTIVRCGVTPGHYDRPIKVWRPGQRFELITTGSLQPYKGQKDLVKACALLRNTGLDFRCRVIGEGEERQALEKLIASRQLGNHVILLGAKTQDQVAILLKTAHCYVQPSIIMPSGKMEGIPVALMEAMAAGLPVVATAISGIPELVRCGKTGYTLAPGAPGQLAALIAQVHQYPGQAVERAENARRLVMDEFNLEKNARRLSRLFSKYVIFNNRSEFPDI